MALPTGVGLESCASKNQAPVRNSSSGLASCLALALALILASSFTTALALTSFLDLGLAKLLAFSPSQNQGSFLTTSIDPDMKSMEVSCLALCLALTLAPFLARGLCLPSSPAQNQDLTLLSHSDPELDSDFFLRPKPGPTIGLFPRPRLDTGLFSDPEPGFLDRFIFRTRTGGNIEFPTGLGPRHSLFFGHVPRPSTGFYPVSRMKPCTDLFSTPEPGVHKGSRHPSEITIVKVLLFGCRPGMAPRPHIGLLL